VLPLLLLEDVHVSGNAKSENPPPPPPKLEICLGDSKVEDAPPPIPPVVPPPVVAVCIDQREHFTIKHKFATRNDLLEWVREKDRKLGFSTIIGKSDNGGNGRSAFVTLIYEREGSYTEYKRKSRRKIAGSVKCECLFRLRRYLSTGGDWSLRVGDGKHNHDMTDVLKGYKTVGRLNPNECVHLEEMVDSNIPPRQMLTNLKKRNRTTSNTIKHVYNASYMYRRSIRGTRNDMQHLLKSLCIMVTFIIVGSIMILMMSVMFFWHIQILSSCLTCSPRCLCLIPHTRQTSIVFHCLSLSVTPLP